ncbi:MAG: UDP-glucose 4-epimerase GalE [Candidatus Rokuibacteriota bacterium]
MNVLVTGGAGYIGSVVAERLLERGHAVVIYDSLVTGHRDAVPAGAAFVEANLIDGRCLVDALVHSHIDAVMHMAARSLVSESVQDPARYYRTNLVEGLTLLDAMREAGIRLIVFSSTAAVYGEAARQPIEELDPTHPTNPYGETKLAFEKALGWYERAYGIRHMSLRYFNAAGATARSGERHSPETHLIPLVLQAAMGMRDSVTMLGTDYPTRDGTCVRDYIHVADLADAHILALDALASGRPSAAYNLGCGGQGYTVAEVIEVARSVTKRSIRAHVGAARLGDPAVLVASSDLIGQALGWRPAHQDLAEIICSAWRWMTTYRFDK